MDLPFSVEPRSFDVSDPHITLQFRPDVSLDKHFGSEFTIIIKGYGIGTPDDCDKSGKCEGILVEVVSENKELNSLYNELENDKNCSSGRDSEFHLHMTLSFDKGEITPVETGFIEFYEFEPDDYIKIESAVFGGFFPDGVDLGDKDLEKVRIAIPEETSEDDEVNPYKDKININEDDFGDFATDL